MGIAGLAITFPLMNLVVAFCTVVSAGGSTISSIRLLMQFIGQVVGAEPHPDAVPCQHSLFGSMKKRYHQYVYYPSVCHRSDERHGM